MASGIEGYYITNEYSVLKRIFQFLPQKDLLVAAQVCSEWDVVAQRVLLEGQQPYQSYVVEHNPYESWPAINAKISPKVIWQFVDSDNPIVNELGSSAKGLYNHLKQTHCLKDTKWYVTYNEGSIMTKMHQNKLEVIHVPDSGNNKFRAALLIAETCGVEVDAFHIECESIPKKPLPKKLLSQNIKGYLLIACRACPEALKWTLSHIKGNQSLSRLPMVGGLTHYIQSVSIDNNKDKINVKEVGILGISFAGENIVSCVTDVHYLHTAHEVFLKKFSETVGPLPPHCMRIAFMFVCINRVEEFEDIETKLFCKYFPDVPIYGFWSFGEFCIKSSTGGDSKNKKKPKLVSHPLRCCQECAAYLVLTIRTG